MSAHAAEPLSRPLRLVLALLSWWAVLLFLVVGGAVSVVDPSTYTAPGFPAIRSDGTGYHLWTRAFVDRDLDFCRYLPLNEGVAITKPSPAGRCGNIYPPGLAILRYPVMSHFTAANGGLARSPAEDLVSDLCALAAGAVAVGATVAVARRAGARRRDANLAALLITFGTGLFHYATLDGSFAHVYVAAGLGLFSWLLVHRVLVDARPARGPAQRAAWALRTSAWAVVPFLLLLTRQTTLLPLAGLVAVAAAYVVRRDGPTSLLRHLVPAVMTSLGVLAALGVQIGLNSYAYGALQVSSYGSEYGFAFGDGQQGLVAFSGEKGAFTVYPIGAVALLGLLAVRRWWALAGVLVPTTGLIVLYGYWFDPLLGGGFGHRGFVDLAPVWGAGLAVALSTARGGIRWLLTVVGVLCATFTVGLMCAYWVGDVGFEGYTGAEHWRYGLGPSSAPVRLLEWVRELG